jgi:hypothetical protein
MWQRLREVFSGKAFVAARKWIVVFKKSEKRKLSSSVKGDMLAYLLDKGHEPVAYRVVCGIKWFCEQGLEWRTGTQAEGFNMNFNDQCVLARAVGQDYGVFCYQNGLSQSWAHGLGFVTLSEKGNLNSDPLTQAWRDAGAYCLEHTSA